MYWRMKATFSGKKRKPENHPQNDTIEVKTSLLKVKSIKKVQGNWDSYELKLMLEAKLHIYFRKNTCDTVT